MILILCSCEISNIQACENKKVIIVISNSCVILKCNPMPNKQANSRAMIWLPPQLVLTMGDAVPNGPGQYWQPSSGGRSRPPSSSAQNLAEKCARPSARTPVSVSELCRLVEIRLARENIEIFWYVETDWHLELKTGFPFFCAQVWFQNQRAKMKKIQKKARQDGKIVKDSEDSEQGNSNKSCKIKEEEQSELPSQKRSLSLCFVLRGAHSTTAIPPQGAFCAFIRHYRDEFLTYESRLTPQRA